MSSEQYELIKQQQEEEAKIHDYKMADLKSFGSQFDEICERIRTFNKLEYLAI
jgi:hypothetical protein